MCMCAWEPKGIGSPGTRVTDDCELPRGLGIEPGPLEEQSVLLPTEPSRQPFGVLLCIEGLEGLLQRLKGLLLSQWTGVWFPAPTSH